LAVQFEYVCDSFRWFAKRFLHPDIVSAYSYIFLWDEDLGVDHFDARRYVSIIKEEKLEISQPALDPNFSEVHHQLTSRDKKSRVHRYFSQAPIEKILAKRRKEIVRMNLFTTF
jgi:hypothetical protein